MPSLKYYDQAAGSYKYVVGGLNQETADARYLMSGFRNVIRNGDMSIAQRGDGPFTTNPGVIDGWSHTAGPNPSITRIVPSPGLGSPVLRVITSGQAAAGDWATLLQAIEGVSTLQGQQVTCSFNAYAASGTPKIAVEVEQGFGTGGSPSALVRLSVGAVTISTTMARYSISFVMPSIAGKTIGTNGNDVCNLLFWLSAGSNNAARASNIGIQNNTFYITDVQLEAGPVATPFERLPVQQQLAWCQRYFQRIGALNPNMPMPVNNAMKFGVGAAFANNNAYSFVDLLVPMRTTPAVTGSVASTFYCDPGGPLTAIVTDISTARSVSFSLVHAPNANAAKDAILFLQNPSSAAYFDFSAEL